jgi:hypothetical protein
MIGKYAAGCNTALKYLTLNLEREAFIQIRSGETSIQVPDIKTGRCLRVLLASFLEREML